MANKFLISDLSTASLPLCSTDYAIVENDSITRKVSFEDIYKDVLSNRLQFKVGRTRKRGYPNVLSVMFMNDNGTSSLLDSVTLQDGMLSAINFDSNSNKLSLFFNIKDGDLSDNEVVIDLDSLEDRYYSGYGLGLSNYTDGQQFFVIPSSMVEITTMSSDIAALSIQSAALCTAIDSKIIIDGLSAQMLSASHISQDDFYQKVVTSSLLSNEIYFISSNYINAYDQQVKNVAEPALSDDAATKNYVDTVVISATEDKADANDLRYSLVIAEQTGDWQFSGSGVQSGHTYDVVVTQDNLGYSYMIREDGEAISEARFDTSQTAVDFSDSTHADPTASITATRAWALQDRAMNAVQLASSAMLQLPAAVPGKARDFVVRLTLTSTTSNNMTTVPSPAFDDSVDYETEGGEGVDFLTAGTYIVRLTETLRAQDAKWVVDESTLPSGWSATVVGIQIVATDGTNTVSSDHEIENPLTDVVYTDNVYINGTGYTVTATRRAVFLVQSSKVAKMGSANAS